MRLNPLVFEDCVLTQILTIDGRATMKSQSSRLRGLRSDDPEVATLQAQADALGLNPLVFEDCVLTRP